MGRVPVPGPFWSSAILATLAARALGERELLTTLAAGEARGTVALQEMGHGDPLDTVRSRARRKGSGWVVSGHKPIVVDGHTADWAIVVARSEEGVRSFLLESPRLVKTEDVPTLDPTRKAANLVLDEQPVDPLGPSGQPVWACGGGCSTTWRSPSLPRRSEWRTGRSRWPSSTPRQRVVFDRPIATFQVVKHRIVDMYHVLEMARVGVQFAAWASDIDAPDWARAAAMAASYAAEAAVRVTGDNIQVHGGVGFTWANDAHFLYKRAKQNEVLFGGTAHERQRLARILIDSA